jgi:hypothetical protein
VTGRKTPAPPELAENIAFRVALWSTGVFLSVITMLTNGGGLLELRLVVQYFSKLFVSRGFTKDED